jgi:DNA-binding NtrC family response regulator
MSDTNHFREWMQIASTPRRVLLIDDSEGDTELIVRTSSEFNIRWEVAYDGWDAIRCLEGCKYQLIVLDLQLNSDLQGVELFKKMKKMCPTTPVLILSGHITNEIITEVTRIGFAIWAQKPAVFASDFFEQLFQALNIPRSGKAREEQLAHHHHEI